MVTIHPTALVDPAAQLGTDVEIGPFSIVEAGVVLGDRTKVGPHALIRSGTRLGSDNHRDHGVVLGGDAQHLRAHGEAFLEIGDHNTFREGVTMHRGSSPGAVTRIGSHGMFMAFSHVGHDCVVDDHVLMANMVAIAGHCHILHHANIGGIVAVHQRVTIGEFAMVGGMSGCHEDVPPFSLTEGQPAKVRHINVVGLRRNGFEPATRNAISKALRLIYSSGRNRSLAIAEVERDMPSSPELCRVLEFVKATQAGKNGRQREH